MPTSKTSPDRAKVLSAPSGLDPQFFVDIGQRACGSWFGGTLELAAEMTDFVRTRAQDDWTNWARLMACTDLNQVFQCQCQAAEKAFRDYLDEAGKLSRLAMHFTPSNAPGRQGLDAAPAAAAKARTA
jgi:hypothetical protein